MDYITNFNKAFIHESTNYQLIKYQLIFISFEILN